MQARRKGRNFFAFGTPQAAQIFQENRAHAAGARPGLGPGNKEKSFG